MESREQLALLCNIGDNPRCSERVRETLRSPLCAEGVDMLQINTGKRCNLRCKHCHVSAGPDRSEIMPREVLEKCLDAVMNSDIASIDITGGSPEMNPGLEWFLDRASRLGPRLMVRSNLVILQEGDYERFTDRYAR